MRYWRGYGETSGEEARKMSGQADTPEVVRAQRFEVVDARGRTRVALDVDVAMGTPGLTLDDEQGKMRAMLSLLPDGTPDLVLCDEKGKTRATLGLARDGEPAVTFFDDKGKERAMLSVGSDGSPGLGLSDENRATRAMLSLLADGTPFLGFADKKGKVMWQAP